MNRIFFCLLAAGLSQMVASAQPAVVIRWMNPANAGMQVIEGQGWPGEVKDRYDRLPARAEKGVRKEVWDLSHQAAGLVIRMRSDAQEIRVRYGVGGVQSFPHMPATGVSGVDLYAVDCDGSRLWAAGHYRFGDTVEYRFGLTRRGCGGEGREYRLYLPLYNSVKWMEIGVADSNRLVFLPVRAEKPLVIYGTSIAQGACASRPGMAWAAILGRKLDMPVVNLGFSGNGRMEKEVAGYVAEIDARIYILDCMPNLVSSVGVPPTDIKARILAAVRIIREKSVAPILLVEHAGYTDGGMDTARRKMYLDANEILDAAYSGLKKEGVKGLYLLSRREIGMGDDMMVDGTHPSDLGMQRYADAYEKCIKAILR